jgi:hypothetical protein
MAKTNTSHDVSFLKSDGHEVGLMLASDKNGFKAYKKYDDQTFPNQFFTGVPDYGYLPPEKEIAIIQQSCEAGFGLEFADSNDDKRYYYSAGVDNRFKGNSILGPLPVAIALPTDYPTTVLTLSNGDFETGGLGNAPTSWTKTGTGTAILGPDAHGGTYECTMTPSTADFTIYQDMVTWDNKYRGVPVKAEAWFYTGNVAQCTAYITIDDGIGTTNSSSLAANNTWTKLQVTRTLNAAATRLRITITVDYISNNNAVLVDDCVVHMAYVAPPVASEVVNDTLYFAMGTCIYKLNGTGDGFTLAGNVYYPITSLCKLSISTTTFLFICCGDDDHYWYMNTVESFTESTLSDGYATYMVNVASSSGSVFYKVILPNEVKKATNPINGGSWSTIDVIGDYENNITSVAVDVDIPYFGKEDTVYYLDTNDASYPMVADMQSLKSSTNCTNMLVWHKKLYVPCGNNGLVEYDNGTVTWRSPSLFCTNLSGFTGSVQALAADEEYLYAIVDNSTKIEILAGQQRVVDGSNVWSWHTLQEITLTGCQYAVVSNIYKKRLWIASTSSSDSVYYIPLTTKYGDITGDTDYSYLTGGMIFLPGTILI